MHWIVVFMNEETSMNGRSHSLIQFNSILLKKRLDWGNVSCTQHTSFWFSFCSHRLLHSFELIEIAFLRAGVPTLNLRISYMCQIWCRFLNLFEVRVIFPPFFKFVFHLCVTIFMFSFDFASTQRCVKNWFKMA
jgi:hypothetical protein